MSKLKTLNSLTNLIRLENESTISFIKRNILEFDKHTPDVLFYSLDIDTQKYINKYIILILRGVI